ncbi:hypothetical protein M3Y99_00738900 [Aphelenchoides fujianensis]|nr:hypothetical protein M3Y99_00738900 [Aphelenchoides fujianensis]
MKSSNSSDRRSIGLVGCIALTIGHVVGSGIFTSPSLVIKQTQSIGAALLVWTAAGLAAASGALTYAEISTRLGRSGGDVAFVAAVGWTPIAFCFAAMQIFVIFPIVGCLQALAFAQHFLQLFGLQSNNLWVNFGVAAGLLTLLLLVNVLVPFRLVMKFNILLAGVKVATLLLVVLLSVRGEGANFAAPLANSTLDPDELVASFYGAFFAFEGYHVACVGVEEVIDPDRNLPLALSISVGLLVVLYAAVNASVCLVVGTPLMIKMDAASLIKYFARVTLGRTDFVLSLLIAVGLINSLNVTLFGYTRQAFVY